MRLRSDVVFFFVGFSDVVEVSNVMRLWSDVAVFEVIGLWSYALKADTIQLFSPSDGIVGSARPLYCIRLTSILQISYIAEHTY